jgi:hypothetical protein
LIGTLALFAALAAPQDPPVEKPKPVPVTFHVSGFT